MFQTVPILWALLLLCSCSQPPSPPGAILVPEQFSGFLMIFTSESCGNPSLSIPADGILITSTALPLSDNGTQIVWADAGPGHRPLPRYQQGAEGRSIIITECGTGEALGMNYTYLRAFVGTGQQIQSAFEKSRAAKGKTEALQKLENCRRTIHQPAKK